MGSSRICPSEARRERRGTGAGPSHGEALRRRDVPALGVGAVLRGVRPRRPATRVRGPGVAQGRARRRRGGARRPTGVGGAHRLSSRSDPVPRRRDHGGAPRAVPLGAPGGGCVRPRSRRGRRDRSVGLVRGLGRQVRADRRRDEPGRRSVLQLHGSGADGRRGDRARPRTSRCWGSCRGSHRPS